MSCLSLDTPPLPRLPTCLVIFVQLSMSPSQVVFLVPNVAIDRPANFRNLFTTEVGMYRNLESWNLNFIAMYF